jgi:sigma-B regulation protein RsbU (phosphoserine phosphatase)
MLRGRRPWQEELAIIDRTMKAISGITDPDELVGVYWNGIGDLIEIGDYVALSRRGETPPHYLITRSSRFEEELNPWTQRDRLPRLSGGILGEIVYANQPVNIDELPARPYESAPAHIYLEGFQSLIALPQYDGGESLNVTCMLLPPGFELDKSVIPILHWQSGLFGRGTTNLVLKNQLGDALKALDKELKAVGRIQRELLPQELPKIDGFEMSAYYRTSARAGGDYYDFFPLSDRRWGMFIADVSGHGTPAAVLMAITHAIAHAQPGTHTPPQQLLGYLNRQLARSYTRNGTFVTAFYAVLDPTKRTLTYSTAGHNPPRLVRGERIIPLDKDGALPLGILVEQDYGQATIALEKGDLLLLYTDGITEAVGVPAPSRESNESRQLFGVERLDELLLDCGAESAPGCIERVRALFGIFTGDGARRVYQTQIAIRCLLRPQLL